MSSIKYISENTPFIITGITNDNFVPDLDYSGHTIGEIVCYSSLYNELINKFGSYENAKEVWSLCRSLINGGQYYEYFIQNGGSIPYLDVDVYLEEEIADNGLFTPVIEKWVPGKKYYVGDMVYYSIDGTDENMIPYILKGGKNDKLVDTKVRVYGTPDTTPTKTIKVKNFTSGVVSIGDIVSINNVRYTIASVNYMGLNNPSTLTFNEEVVENALSKNDSIYKVVKDVVYEEVEIPYSIYKSYDSRSVLIERDGKYYIKLETYTGYFDEKTQLIYFDDLDVNRKLVFNHWERAEVVSDMWPIEDTGDTYETVTESLLLNVKRKKTSMDDSSNILPFIAHYIDSAITGTRYTKKILDTATTECFYMIGIANTTVNPNGAVTCDYLKSVKFTNDDGSEELTYTDVGYRNMPILCDDSFSDYTKIIFTYYIGAELNRLSNLIPNTGVKYVEERSFTVKHMDAIIDKINCEDLPYFNISEDYEFAKDENEDLANSGHGSSFADVSLEEVQVGKTPFSDIGIVKDEKINSVQDFSDDIDVDIERGIATSFERHNALGEINTMQDLEHYRNDFFDVSKP